MINALRSEIKNKLLTLSSVQEINDYEKSGFDGFPAVNILFTGNEANFYSTASNHRSYNFKLIIFIPLKGNPLMPEYDNAKQKAEKAMGDVVDEIITAFDKDITLKNGGETRNAESVGAAPSRWGYAQIGEGWARTAEINLSINKQIIVRS